MNSSPQAAHRSPCSTKVYPSISEVMSSAGTSLRFPQLGHRVVRLSLGSRDDKDLTMLGVVRDHQLLVSFLSDEDFPLSRSDTRYLVRFTQRFPQIDLIPIPFSHPRIPEVLAHVDLDFVDVEREQSASLSYVMSFIYINTWMGCENPPHRATSLRVRDANPVLYEDGPTSRDACQAPATSATSTSTTGGSSATSAMHSRNCRRTNS